MLTQNGINIVHNNHFTFTAEAEMSQLQKELNASQDECERLNESLQFSKDLIRELRSEISNLESSTGIDYLREQLSLFTDTAEQAAKEFMSYLQTVNLSDGRYVADGRLTRYIEEIQEGAMTSQQAIFRLKTDCSDLLDMTSRSSGAMFDDQSLQMISATLDRIGEKVEVVLDRLEKIQTEGVKTAEVTTGGTNNIAETLLQISAASEKASQGSGEAIGSISQLVSSITEFANIDSTRLMGVSNAFRNISSIGEGSFSSKSFIIFVIIHQ